MRGFAWQRGEAFLFLIMTKPKATKTETKDECTITERVSMAVLRAMENKSPEHEKHAITEYVESQAKKDDEKVLHLEKVKTESTLNGKLDAWDVYTDRSRYWVITNPTNLYAQELFPGLDYTITIHVGVTTRMMANRKKVSGEDVGNPLIPALRQWEQAAEAFDLADEAEEFQAVGARCRECLTTLVKMLSDPSMVPEG